MNSTVTIIIYMVLLGLLGFIYWLVNKRDIFGEYKNKNGSPDGVTRTIRGNLGQTFLGSIIPGRNPLPAAQPTNVVEEIEAAAAVLDDMYREFSAEIRLVRADLETAVHSWRTEWLAGRSDLLARLERIEQRMNDSVMTPRSQRNAPLLNESPMQAMESSDTIESFDTRYLEVLDLHQRQVCASDIAEKLGLSIHEVELVISVMMKPPAADKSNLAPS